MVSGNYRLAGVLTFLHIIYGIIAAILNPRKYSLLKNTLTTTATQVVYTCRSHAQYNNIIYYTVSQVSNCNNNDGMCIHVSTRIYEYTWCIHHIMRNIARR